MRDRLARCLLRASVLSVAAFLILIGINIFEQSTGRLLGKPLSTAVLSEASLPLILVQIPVFNEPAMVADCLRSAAALDWPRDRLHIQLLDDSTDETTVIANAVVRELHAQGYLISHLHRMDRRGYKAGALAAGLAQSDAPFVAVLDAISGRLRIGCGQWFPL